MRLIRGSAGSGKTALVFREFKEALRLNRNTSRLIVPTSTLVRHFQHELARDGCVFPPCAVVSLKRFVGESARDLKPVPDVLLRLIVKQTLAALKLPEFQEVSETAGMTSTILETISLFQNAGVAPERLAAIRKLSRTGKAFAALWQAVNQAIHASGYSNREEMMRAAASRTDPLRIWMDGFVTLSPLENQLVASLAQRCELTLTVTDAPAGDDIRRFALQQGAEERLLQGPRRKPAIAAVEAASTEREADEIARRILELHEKGIPFREIAVAVRDTDSCLALLRGTLERFGIPARFYFSQPLRPHPAARFLNGVVKCILSEWEFGETLEALRAHPAWGVSAALDRFDFEVREAMPGRGVEALLALAGEDMEKKLRPIFAVDAWREDRVRPALWQRRLTAFLQSVYRPSHDLGAVETARSHVAAYDACVQALGFAADCFADREQPITLERFWGAASEAIDASVIQIPDNRRDVVHVMSAFEARQWDVTALFVCGMTDRQFPKKNPQNLLFPDTDIDALQKAGIPLRKAADLDKEEIALFESLKTRATDSLILSWPCHDAAGKTVESSRFIGDLPASPARVCRATPAKRPSVPGISGAIQSAPLLNILVSQHRKISLSALEDMAQCRFKFFAGRTLGLRGRPERPQERLQPRVTGLILHEALEAWLNIGRHGDFVEVFEQAFDKACREKHLPAGYRLEVERVFLRGIAQAVSATDRWDAVSSEAEVPLELDFPGGVTVSCRVDRIDRVSETDCIIVDYKSGQTANVGELVTSATKLQGPFYALAAKEKLGLNTVAMMYIAVRDDRLFGWGEVPGRDLGLNPIPPRWMEDARDRAVERLTSLLRGDVHADPTEPAKCKWCDFAEACRFGAEAAKTETAHGD